MYCQKCGFQNADDATACVGCGAAMWDVSAGLTTSRLAKASLTMGLLCLTLVLWPLLAIPAIVCGVMALVKISDKKNGLKGTGLALAGLGVPIGLLFLLPIPLLMFAAIMPATVQVKGIAQSIVCSSNLQGLSVAMQVYTYDYDDQLPTENWCDLLIEEADVSPYSFVCQDSDAVEGESCYAMNKHAVGKKLSDLPPNMVLFFETDLGVEAGPRTGSITERRHHDEFLDEFGIAYDENAKVYKDRFNQLGGPEDVLVNAHNRNDSPGCNVAFVDGHIEFVAEEDIDDLQWTDEETAELAD